MIQKDLEQAKKELINCCDWVEDKTLLTMKVYTYQGKTQDPTPQGDMEEATKKFGLPAVSAAHTLWHSSLLVEASAGVGTEGAIGCCPQRIAEVLWFFLDCEEQRDREEHPPV
jgi:hypothetical protein